MVPSIRMFLTYLGSLECVMQILSEEFCLKK